MMHLSSILLICLAAFLGQALAAPKDDLITKLPGVDWRLNFKQYSGYLQGTGTNRLHYWFVESSSNPSTDPLVVWFNGGPGCSSLEGILSEHGPFTIQPDGKTLKANPFAWNQVASMIYLEAPAGVGFSYNKDANYTTDDDVTAQNNHLALKDFFTKFPEYKSNDFYVSGESYAGIYVPTLVDNILKDSSIKLKGFLVGNGLSDYEMNSNSIVYFSYYHGLIGDVTFDSIVETCCPGNKSLRCNFAEKAKKSEECNSKLGEIRTLVWGSGLNVYNLYAECYGGVSNNMLSFNESQGKYVTSRFLLPYFTMKNMKNDVKNMLLRAPKGMVKSSPPCINSYPITNYLNITAVRMALHIPKEVDNWEFCSSTVVYKGLYSTMTPQYKRALAVKNLRIMLYNGDVDMACNFLGDEWFVESLHPNKPHVRKVWYYKAADNTKQVAGFYKQYDQITFVTVLGSGHMVPTDKPRQALKMFVNYIQDLPL